MGLNSRTAPQKSFGRRAIPAPPSAAPSPPEPKPVEEVLRDAQPAPNWLAEITGQNARPLPQPEPSPDSQQPAPEDQSADEAGPQLDAGSLITRSLQILAKNPVTFLAVFAVIALPEQSLAYVPLSLGLPAAIISPVFTTLGCTLLYVAIFHGALASLNGSRVNLDVCLCGVAQTSRQAFGVVAVTVSSLSLMLILPAVGFAGRWALAAPVALVEGQQARARSLALTAPYRAQIRWLVLLVVGLTLLRALLAVILSTSSVVGALTGDCLFPMLLTVLVAVAGAVLYRELVPADRLAEA